MVTGFMVHGTAGLMKWMMDSHRYGMKIHMNTPAAGYIGWGNGDELSHKTMRFTMGAFRGFIYGLTASARQLMINQILRCQPDQIPVIPWDRMADDFNQPKDVWSFCWTSVRRGPLKGRGGWWTGCRRSNHGSGCSAGCSGSSTSSRKSWPCWSTLLAVSPREATSC